MDKIAGISEKIAERLEKTLSYISMTVLVILITIVFFQVAYRTITGKAFTVIEELSTVLAAWIAFLTLAYAVRKKVHVAIDYFVSKLPNKVQYFITEIINVFLLFILSYITLFSVFLVDRKMNVPMTILPIKSGYWYLAFPVGMIIACFFLINNIIQGVKKIKDHN